MAEVDIAIVGGGASGTLVAIHLLQKARAPFAIALLERGAQIARGLAYSTREPDHLLNVPALKMSALPDAPDHFARWAGVPEDTFVERRRYGEYLEHVLRESAARAAQGVVFSASSAAVASACLHDRRLRLSFESGGHLDARAAVLALGNFPSLDLSVPDGGLYASDRYARSPFVPGALDGIDDSAPVVFLGSGLTMVDAALALRARGHRGPLHAVSRHGLVPQVHAPAQPSRVRIGAIGVRGLLRSLRAEVRREGDWRAVFDVFRSSAQRIWRRLPTPERQRFVRHLRAYWEVHRHRMAPRVGEALETMQRNGELSVHAGRIASFALLPGEAVVRFRPRGSRHLQELRCARVINCTGPASRIDEICSPLVSSLLSSGLAQAGSLGMGFRTDREGALIGDSGGRLFTLGSLRRGDLWESTAVPELRDQARALASRILADFAPSVASLRHASS